MPSDSCLRLSLALREPHRFPSTTDMMRSLSQPHKGTETLAWGLWGVS